MHATATAESHQLRFENTKTMENSHGRDSAVWPTSANDNDQGRIEMVTTTENDHGSNVAASPTASLEACKHCGEEYCMDAELGVAQVARRYTPTSVTISRSAPSPPANPLRKKRKLDSLLRKAKEQADPTGRAMSAKAGNSSSNKAADDGAPEEAVFAKLNVRVPHDFRRERCQEVQMDQELRKLGWEPMAAARRGLN